MEPQIVIITITPHEDPEKVSLHVEWRGIFTDEGTVLKGRTAVSREELLQEVSAELGEHHRHEIACKALDYI